MKAALSTAAPCSGCEHFERCAIEQLSCREFAGYAQAWMKRDGTDRYYMGREPTRAAWKRLFPNAH